MFSVQKKDGGEAQGMVATELLSMLDHVVLPHYLLRALDGATPDSNASQYDDVCREHAILMSEHDSGLAHVVEDSLPVQYITRQRDHT